MPDNKFDQKKYIAEWKKENMKYVNCAFKAEFVEEFREACRKLGLKQSDVVRTAMEETIKRAEAG